MIKYCLEKWDKNKGILEDALRKDKKLNSCNYIDLVKLVVKHILNDEDECYTWDENHITLIDNGDYQGTQLFMIPRDTYQPSSDEYLLTYQYYGSCCGCDTLQGIQWLSDDDGLPSERQIKDFIRNDLHIELTYEQKQRLKYMLDDDVQKHLRGLYKGRDETSKVNTREK